MSRISKHFPQTEVCPLCGNRENKECVLVPVDGTQKGINWEAAPIHTECLQKYTHRMDEENGIIYIEYNKIEYNRGRIISGT